MLGRRKKPKLQFSKIASISNISVPVFWNGAGEGGLVTAACGLGVTSWVLAGRSHRKWEGGTGGWASWTKSHCCAFWSPGGPPWQMHAVFLLGWGQERSVYRCWLHAGWTDPALRRYGMPRAPAPWANGHCHPSSGKLPSFFPSLSLSQSEGSAFTWLQWLAQGWARGPIRIYRCSKLTGKPSGMWLLELLQPSCHHREVLSEDGANLEEKSTETEKPGHPCLSPES